MSPQTENIIRNVVTLDPAITTEQLEQALSVLRGQHDFNSTIDHVLRRKEVEEILHVHRRTIDYYLEKGYLRRVYGGGRRAVGISRESLNNFLRRRIT